VTAGEVGNGGRIPLAGSRKLVILQSLDFVADLYWESAIMARSCEVCGKGPEMGNSVETRGKAKYLGGVGTKITGITRRKFKPNLQKVRVTLSNGTNKSMQVCTRCLRSGAVTKRVRVAPFRLPSGESKATSK